MVDRHWNLSVLPGFLGCSLLFLFFLQMDPKPCLILMARMVLQILRHKGLSQEGSSAGKGTYHQARRPEFNSWTLQDRQ